MMAILRGIKVVEYPKNGEMKRGIELHCERKPYPSEGFIAGSDVVFTEYVSIRDEASEQFAKRIKDFEIGSKIELVYVQMGRYSTLVDVQSYLG